MKQLSRPVARALAIGTLALGASLAQAHTGHGTSTLYEGLAHPFGLDHLLAMVAVGMWSVVALPAGKAWWGPATFLLALLLGAVAGMLGLTIPALEILVSLSVVLFGAMLLLAHRQPPARVGIALIATAATLHGLAHGAEAPLGSVAGYAAGFIATTAALHVGGALAALGIKRHLAAHATRLIGSIGVVLGGVGLYLVSQL